MSGFWTFLDQPELFYINKIGQKKTKKKWSRLAKISKTAIFYINSNNGFTLFESDNQKVESIENRLVIFDSFERHSGTNCTDEKYRAVINFNFI